MARSGNTSRKGKFRKAAPPQNALWKKVDVSLPDTGAGASAAPEEDEEHNHYDNRSLQRQAKHDLEAKPGEEMGFFLGLEVMDGSSYTVEHKNGSQTIVLAPQQQPSQPAEEASSAAAPADEEANKKAASHVASETNKGAGEKSKKKKKGKKRKLVVEEASEGTAKASSQSADGSQSADPQVDKPSVEGSPLKKPKKKKKKQKKKPVEADAPSEEQEESVDETKVVAMQTAWMTQTGGVTFHPEVCRSLLRQEFWTPTPIQAACLPAAVLGRRNIVGAAPTGSGKTLAFLLPIFQSIMEEEDVRGDVVLDKTTERPLKALVVAPTRELAKQIFAECEKLGRRRTALVVGGLAHVKQERLLQRQPPIVVGTPGRLWEMISSKEYKHLSDLSQVRFLVLDEVDRMIQLGSFPQLEQILDQVQSENPMDDDEDEEEEDIDEEGMNDPDRLLGLPGIPGEARVQMLSDDMLRQLDAVRGDSEVVETREVEDDEFDEMEMMLDENEADGSEDELSLPLAPPVYRQTFVFSATLTLPATKVSQANKKRRFDGNVGGAIAEILDKSHAKGKTKVVDLSTNTKGNDILEKKSKESKNAPPSVQSNFQLPPGLQLQHIKCTQKHKDSYLYAYLMTTRQGMSGPSLVFCNSIAGAKRVAKTLQTLGIDVRVLHAQMQQRARFKAMEKLRSLDRTVVVATDVASRGIDIPSIRCVIHYDVARTVDTFVHRAGRTARGMGDNASGHSFSLIAPAEDRGHAAILASLNTKFDNVLIDGRLLREAQERVNLATKIVEVSEVEQHAQQNNRWFEEQAREAGLDLDDDMLEEGMGQGPRDRSKVQDAKSARARLSILLAQPLRTQRHGKFLSTNSSAPLEMQQIKPVGGH